MRLRFHSILTIFLTCGLTASAQLSGDGALVVDANNSFALRLYHELSREPGSVFFSPYSISSVLALAYAGARGETASEIAKAMAIQLPAARFHTGSSIVSAQLSRADHQRQLFLANRLWAEKHYRFAPAFLSLLQNNYGVGFEALEFQRDPEAARKIINKWVQDRTRDRIKDLLAPGLVRNETQMVLTSAIYFKAAWVIPFETGQTSPGEFYLTVSQKIRVPMMRRSFARVRYFASADMVGLELPYQNDEFSMILLMSTKVDGLSALEKSLNIEELKKRLSALSLHDVDLAIPRFQATREYSLKAALESLGMVRAWTDAADFGGIVPDGSRKLVLSAAVHKAFVEVNERGTEASAATGLVMEMRAYPNAIFHADRPFVYLIRESKTGSILFMGRVADPR
jgi:serpin B